MNKDKSEKLKILLDNILEKTDKKYLSNISSNELTTIASISPTSIYSYTYTLSNKYYTEIEMTDSEKQNFLNIISE